MCHLCARPLSLHDVAVKEWRCIADHSGECQRAKTESQIVEELLLVPLDSVVRAAGAAGLTLCALPLPSSCSSVSTALSPPPPSTPPPRLPMDCLLRLPCTGVPASGQYVLVRAYADAAACVLVQRTSLVELYESHVFAPAAACVSVQVQGA
jgi:hypothetical protein